MKIGGTIGNIFRFVNLSTALIVWAFFICRPSIAQIKLSDFENVTHYSIENGLPTSEVNQIKEDRFGFLWIATDDGVSRFDGTSFMNFMHYKHNNAFHRIHTVHTLLMDKLNERLWVGSDKGLFYTTMDTLEFKKFDVNGNLFTAYSSNVLSLFKDDDNRLWVGGSSGLLSINLNDLKQDPIIYNKQIPLLSKPFSGIRNISTDLENTDILWLGTTKGLIRFNYITSECKDFSYKNKPELDENSIRKIHATQNEILIGTWSAGLIIFDKKEKTYRKPLQASNLNSHNLISDFYYDQNILWITTINGLIQYDCASQQILEVHSHDIEGGKIKGVSYVDSRGIIWYGNSLGLFKYSQKDSDFRFIKLENRNKVDVPMTPRRIAIINDIYYVAGYASAGIYKINPGNQKVEVIKIPQFDLQPFGYVIMDMVKMPDNRLLITSDKQLVILDTETKQSTISPLQIDHPNPSIQTIVKDKNDKYWVGSRQAGLFKLDFAKDSITSFKKALNEYKNDNYIWINKLYIDSKNKLWIAKGSHTVMDLDKEVVYNLNLKDSTPFYKDVYGIQEDSKGRIWMAGGKWGLGYTNFNNFRKGIKHKFDGNFYGIYNRNENVLWTIVDNQLGELNLHYMKHNTISIGKSNETVKPTGPIINNGKGEYVIGCKNGILLYNNSKKKTDNIPSSPYITAINANGESVFNGRNLNTHNFNFNSNTTIITVKLSALCFNSTENISYSYKIKDDWIKTSLDDEINFTNLPPGYYSFQLKASNKSMSQQKNIATYQFSIQPPWWKSWWAYLSYIGALAALVWWFYRFQLSRKLAVAEGQRLKEINQLKNNLYTNITHEFRTPLTVILGMTDLLKVNTKGNGITRSKSLEMIERNCNKLLQLVNEMLDLAKLQNGSMVLNQITADVIPFIKYLCESFQPYAEESNIKLKVISEIDELIMDFDSAKLSAIISNLLSNAIKFTPEGGEIVVHLKQNQVKNKDCFNLKVKDTGIGISKDSLPHVFNRFYQIESHSSNYVEGTGIGLALTKELVELMGGTIDAESEPGKGSEFIVELPIEKTALQLEESPTPLKPNPLFESEEKSHSEQFSNDKNDLPLALIIEDSKDVAYYLKTCLHGCYKTIHAQNGKIGLEMAYENIPDVIICDVMMPEKDGFEVCSTLKTDQRTDHIPIVLLTVRTSDKDRLFGLEHGADAYLAKPFNMAELYIRLNKLIELRKKMIGKIANDGFSTLLKRKVEKPETKFLQKTIKIIHSEMENDLFCSNSLARNLNLSESQLYRKLKAVSGKSTAVFIRSVRLQKAKELLQTTNKTIAEIAYEVGFNDPSWFSRAFKEEFGFAPSAMHKSF
ncbi:MAG: ATP-binding protein [Bacteroidota bacterium]